MKPPRQDLTQEARRFHALSDETRLHVVELLARGERCVCELQETLDAAQSRLSFHLKVLRDAGIVSDRRQGRWVFYSLRPEALDGMAAFLQEHGPRVGAAGACGKGGGRMGSCCA